MFERTQGERWRDLFLRNCDHRWQAWQRDEIIGGYLWEQDLYGWRDMHRCALHGFAGIVFAHCCTARARRNSSREHA